MNGKQRLELTWIGKHERPRLEPRILLEDGERSYQASRRVGLSDQFNNKVVYGDNLLALRALEGDLAGLVKCIYIDPPYNSGAAFEEYNDGLEHSTWLTLIRDRVERLWPLLSRDGSLWVSIDDREMPYLRVLLDEVAGRENFIAACVWQKRYSRENREAIGDVHEYILVYAREPATFKANRNMLPLTDEQRKVYKNPNNDPRGPWRTIPITAQAGHATKAQFYTIVGPTGKSFDPPPGSCWRYTAEVFERLKAQGRIYFGKEGTSQPTTIRYLSEVAGAVPWTWWPYQEVGHTDESMKESQALFGKEFAFPTPKPERLLQRIIQIATNPGDVVLDSFAGSGTTGAVAHKMGRRWIMIEQAEHCHTHIIPRLTKVVNGDDPGGVTQATGWKGGGGFRYFRLAPSLVEKDEWGNEVISTRYNPEMLAEAMCKHMGFAYDPSPDHFWMHGRSTERDFVYVTTAALTHEQLAKISDLVGPDRTLLICCRAFQGERVKQLENLTVVKIPHAILSRCEWGKDDYSMGLVAMEQATEAEPDEEPAVEEPPKRKRGRRRIAADTPTLFDEEDEE